MAFVNSGGGCNRPGQRVRLTGGVHASYISQIKAAGADVIPSIGGWSGQQARPELRHRGPTWPARTEGDHAFGLKAIDIDIENTDDVENTAVQDRS